MNSQQPTGSDTPPRDDQEPESRNIVAGAAALGISSESPSSDTVDGFPPGLHTPSTKRETPSGQVVFGGKETQYVGATHWAAILNDVRALFLTNRNTRADYQYIR